MLEGELKKAPKRKTPDFTRLGTSRPPLRCDLWQRLSGRPRVPRAWAPIRLKSRFARLFFDQGAAPPFVEFRLNKPLPPESAPLASFEDAMRELEAIVAKMDEGSLGLEDSLLAYRRGAELVKQCQVSLEAVREQVQVLDGTLLRPLAAVEKDSDAAQ
jgi:exodeoxyribonuclease VII small subunit